jgi:hypothetical protein
MALTTQRLHGRKVAPMGQLQGTSLMSGLKTRGHRFWAHSNQIRTFKELLGKSVDEYRDGQDRIERIA